jgi:MoxR-like ATPase
MSALAALRTGLDVCLVGQREAKQALLVGLIARQHVYLEGPPGCGKSQLARALAQLSGASSAEPLVHRDLRAEDLLGEARLERERDGERERLRQRRAPLPLLAAELWLLDGITRAPGAALAPLMRALAERRALGRALPLECALATAGVPEQETAAEPLEPAWLDRFPLQVRMTGLIAAGELEAARSVLDGEPAPPLAAVLAGPTRGRLQRAAAQLPLSRDVARAWLALLEALAERLDPELAQRLSDRALLAAAPAVFRAHALLRGAPRVELEDLAAARLLLARRIPAEQQEELEQVLDAAAHARVPSVAPAADAGRSGSPGAGSGASQSAAPGSAARYGSAPLPQPARPASPDRADVLPLLRALEGEWARGRRGLREDPSGAPRGQRRLRALDEILDADPLETWLYAEGSWPGLPHAWRRQRRGSGAVALLRDVSASMEGRLSVWAGQVIAGLVRSARRSGLRVGYVEFAHEALCFRDGGRFFHRRYSRVLAQAARRRAAGRTSYEAPLRAALDELRRAPDPLRHVVLLTDGLPVAGDPEVRVERALARRLRVRVHTVFVGLGTCPEVLDRLSAETGGLAFLARPDQGGRIRVQTRTSRPELESCMNV